MVSHWKTIPEGEDPRGGADHGAVIKPETANERLCLHCEINFALRGDSNCPTLSSRSNWVKFPKSCRQSVNSEPAGYIDGLVNVP